MKHPGSSPTSGSTACLPGVVWLWSLSVLALFDSTKKKSFVTRAWEKVKKVLCVCFADNHCQYTKAAEWKDCVESAGVHLVSLTFGFCLSSSIAHKVVKFRVYMTLCTFWLRGSIISASDVGRFADKWLRLQVVSPTSRFVYIEVVSPTLKSIRLHDLSRFAYS